MKRDGNGDLRWQAGLVLLLVLGAAALVSACAGGSPPATSASQQTSAQQPAQATAVPAAAKTSPTAAPTQAAAAKSPTVPAVSIEACSLLTTEEVQAVVGQAVRAQVDSSDPRGIGCSYFGTSETDKSRLASYSVFPATTPSQAKAAHEATKGGGRDQVAVPGLGDDAYFDKTFGLNVLKGLSVVGLSVSAQAEREINQLEATKALASKLLARLP